MEPKVWMEFFELPKVTSKVEEAYLTNAVHRLAIATERRSSVGQAPPSRSFSIYESMTSVQGEPAKSPTFVPTRSSSIVSSSTTSSSLSEEHLMTIATRSHLFNMNRPTSKVGPLAAWVKDGKKPFSPATKEQRMLQAKEEFHVSPVHSMKTLVEKGLVPDPERVPPGMHPNEHSENCAQKVAHLLYHEEGFSKAAIGRLFQQNQHFIRRVMSAYLRMIPMQERSLQACLYEVMSLIYPFSDERACVKFLNSFAIGWYSENLFHLQNGDATCSSAVLDSVKNPLENVLVARAMRKALSVFSEGPAVQTSPASGKKQKPNWEAHTLVLSREWWWNAVTAQAFIRFMLQAMMFALAKNKEVSRREHRKTLTRKLLSEIAHSGVCPKAGIRQVQSSNLVHDLYLMRYIKTLYAQSARNARSMDTDREDFLLYQYFKEQRTKIDQSSA